jgi:hypothetical protein
MIVTFENYLCIFLPILITIPSNVIGFFYITAELGYNTRIETRKDGRIIFKWTLRMENGGEWLGTVSSGVVWY